MAIIIRCDECRSSFRVRDESAGKRFSCRDCGNVIFVQHPEKTRSRHSRSSRNRKGTRKKPPVRDKYNDRQEASYDYEDYPKRSRRHSSRKRPAVMTILRLGLGRFWSFWGIMGIVLCVMLLLHSIERFVYALKSNPIKIDASANGVSHNDYVQLTAQLDFEDGLQIEPLVGKPYTLIPVMGSDKKLIVYEKGHVVLNREVGRERTFTGRIVERGLDDEWDLDGERIELVQQFTRENIIIPEDAFVLDSSDHPEIQPWAMFVGFASLGILIWAVVRTVNTIQLLIDDDKLAQRLSEL